MSGRWRVATLLLALEASSVAASAQPEPELAAARALFAEALHDEEAGRAAVALEKFRKVRDVRDTAQVEYRIATCEEGLGRLVAAAAAYAAAITIGTDAAGSEEVVAGAHTRLAAVESRIGHLTVSIAEPGQEGREVFVDGVTPSGLSGIALDPGPHVVSARAPGALPFQRELMMPEGGQLGVSVVLPASGPAPSSARRTAGWISVAGGVALLAGAGVLAGLRQGDIDTLDSDCPRGICPQSDRASLEATRNRALVEGPVAVGLGVAGAVAAGVGVFLLVGPLAKAKVAAGVTGLGVDGAGFVVSGLL